MTGRSKHARANVIRALGGERAATRAEQLRALGNSDRVIARILHVDRDALAHWFALQDELALCAAVAEDGAFAQGDLGGAA